MSIGRRQLSNLSNKSYNNDAFMFGDERAVLVNAGLMASEGQGDMPAKKKVVLAYSIVTMVVALVFFVWAVVNTAGGEGFDIGMACFPFAFIGGLTGVYASLRTRRMYTGAHIAALAFGVMVVVFAYAWSMGGHNVNGDDTLNDNLKHAVPLCVWVVATIIFIYLGVRSTQEDDPFVTIAVDKTITSWIMVLYSIALILATATYFVIALRNSHIDPPIDIGVICFPIYMIGGVTGLYAADASSKAFIVSHVGSMLFGMASVGACYGYAFTVVDFSDDHALLIHWIITVAVWVVMGLIFVLVALKQYRTISRWSGGGGGSKHYVYTP